MFIDEIYPSGPYTYVTIKGAPEGTTTDELYIFLDSAFGRSDCEDLALVGEGEWFLRFETHI